MFEGVLVMGSNMFYLFIGYAVIWASIFFYTLLLGKRQNQAEKELELLKQSLQPKKKAS